MASEKPTIYWMPESAPCRSVYLVAKILGIDCEWKVFNLFKKEQMNPEFLAINPLHCVPTLVESDGFTLWESRVICSYLIESRDPDSALYPKDLKKRAIIDRCLHFDLGTLYRALADYDILFFGKPNLTKLPRLEEVLQLMEDGFAKIDSDYLAGGDGPTLADIVSYFTLQMLDILQELDLTKYSKLYAWRERMEEFVKSNDDGSLAKGLQNFVGFAQQMQQQHSS
ncbi:Glutathione S-transferase 1, isoform C [Sarcoptes scabiei]|nr:Glutathione S-transferase 1, isoform C [Sarcoptes scabiei]